MSDLKPLNRETASLTQRYPERIVQFGAGNFLRAFVDEIIHKLNQEADFDSGVVVVKVTPGTYEALDNQDGLFHVRLEGYQDGELYGKTTLVDCVTRTVYPYNDFAEYLALAEQPDIRFLISNTTEAGISYNAEDRPDDNPPSSFPAKLAVFLHHRYQHFEGAADKGCIIIPTELVVDNGSQLQEMVLSYAELWSLESGFAEWISQHNLFCNTLVDRIVPGYPADRAESLLAEIGYDDKLLVMGEPYYSWIIDAPESLADEFPVTEMLFPV